MAAPGNPCAAAAARAEDSDAFPYVFAPGGELRFVLLLLLIVLVWWAWVNLRRGSE